MRTLCVMGNAASIHTLRWTAYFGNGGWNVALISWRKPRPDFSLPPSVAVHRIHFPPHYLLRWLALMEVARILGQVRPDIIHAHYVGTFGIIAGLYCRLVRFRPLVVSIWGPRGLLRARGIRRRLSRLALEVADRVHIDGENMLDVLRVYDVCVNKAVLIHYGTDVSLFRPGARTIDARRRIACGEDSLVVVSVRTLEPIYDVATLIRAAKEVAARLPNSRFVIAGDGSQRRELEGLVSSLHLEGVVTFVGRQSQNDMAALLASSDVYVSTSLSDAGIAASTAEAMACGLPAVVTDFGDNGSWVKHGETGYLFPCGDAERLAERLILLLRDKRLRERLGANGRREIEQRNSYQGEMAKMERIYKELIERHKR